jgi:16S rRNA (adenine1518-N6/adenine1519-N6)-dimethyltransferase
VTRARKRFGQHFLHDPAVIERLARAIAPRPADHLVEIGPGRGALTHALLRFELASLDAVEVDRDLAAMLRAQLATDARFALHQGDALDFDFRSLAQQRGAPLRIVGNLPYNISTPLLFHLLASTDCISDLHVMLQREVVERIVATPGSRDYGRLTLMLAPRLEAQHLFDIGPGAFAPPPKVWSAVVRFSVRRTPLFAPGPLYGALVAAAFAHRRKTLRNALKDHVSAALIRACDIDPAVRPEMLTPAQFNALARAAAEAGGASPSPHGSAMG